MSAYTMIGSLIDLIVTTPERATTQAYGLQRFTDLHEY